jgi:hypothetical protein
MDLLSLAVGVVALALAGDPQDDQPAAKRRGESRLAVSIADEGSLAAGLRVPGGDLANLLLVQSSFTYKRANRWRFSSSLAAFARSQAETHTQLRPREVYLGFSAGDLDLTAGKRLLRWGTGYAFTATGVLDPPRVATDPTDRLSLNEGRELIQADWIRGGHDFSVVWASAGLLERHRPGMRETTAFRYNALIEGFDMSVIVAHDRGSATFPAATSRGCSARLWRHTGSWPGATVPPCCSAASTPTVRE